MKLRISLTLMLGVYPVVSTSWQILPLLLMLQWYTCAVISVTEWVKNRLWETNTNMYCYHFELPVVGIIKAPQLQTLGEDYLHHHNFQL